MRGLGASRKSQGCLVQSNRRLQDPSDLPLIYERVGSVGKRARPACLNSSYQTKVTKPNQTEPSEPLAHWPTQRHKGRDGSVSNPLVADPHCVQKAAVVGLSMLEQGVSEPLVAGPHCVQVAAVVGLSMLE